jgi:hypothetical protein
LLPSDKSNELKAEVYWKKKDWENFLQSFNALTNKSEEGIMKAAIAYAMIGDNLQLADFQRQNLKQMKDSKYAKAFKFISKNNALDYNNLAESLGMDFAKEAINDYKESMKLTDSFSKNIALTDNAKKAAPKKVALKKAEPEKASN